MSGEALIENKALETYRILDTIKNMRHFMFEDLNKTIGLVNTDRGAPNFLLALVLCCYTELWGKLLKGIPEGQSADCFNTFFILMGDRYQNLHNKLEEQIKKNQIKNKLYRDIRCGLAHAYLVEGNAKIVIEGGDCGILYDDNSETYTFCIRHILMILSTQ
jgi:hypothetical protein